MKKSALWSLFHDLVGVLSSSKFNQIVENYDIEWLFSASEKELKEMGTLLNQKQLFNFISKRKDVDVLSRETFLTDLGIQLIFKSSKQYPQLLKTLYDAPALLYIKGQASFENLHIGVVGSRSATAYGLAVSANISESLSKENVCVVSGLARGIDTKAHQGALKGIGGTIAVLGSGLNVVYPRENKLLYQEILNHQNGMIISELPLDEAPKPYHFPRRNRIITGLCNGILVVEAKEKSGALITAGIAMEEGRDVFAIPGLITSKESVGCHRLIKDGAKLVSNKMDILEEYGQLSLFNPIEMKKPDLALSEKEKLVYEQISSLPISFEELVVQTQLNVSELMGVLSWLELSDLIEELIGRQYIRKIIV